MDSLTQIALGATVAAAVGFKPFGRKVLLAGAFLGTVPDLDVLIDYGNHIDNYTSHRGFSHSLFVLTLLSIVIYFIALKLKPQLQQHKLALFSVIFLPLITHPLLDSFTTYGTQLLWPLTSPPIAWNSIFIIDPLYTLPLITSMCFLWFSKNKSRAIKGNLLALSLSSLYLIWGQFAQHNITHKINQGEASQNSQILVMPTPFNTLYWRVLRYQGEHYDEAFTHVGDNSPLEWQRYNNNRYLIDDETLPYLQRMEWFSHGWLRFDNVGGLLQVTDLRLGVAGFHPFAFGIAQEEHNRWQTIEPTEVALDEQKKAELFQTIKNKLGL